MRVARLRGQKFYRAHGDYYPVDSDDSLAWEVLDDIAEWLGFEDMDGYLEALPKERERIFDRATY